MNCHWLQPVDYQLNNNMALAKNLNNNDFCMNGNNLAKAQHAIDSIILQLKQEAIHVSDFLNCHWRWN